MALIQINIAVLLFSLAGILAKFIALPALAITFGRVFFSAITLFVYNKSKGQSLKINPSSYGLMLGGGILLAIHWWLFLESIKLSSVAIGTITFATFPLYLTFMEPWLFKEKIKVKNVLLSLAIILGVVVMVDDFSLASRTTFAILIGLVSAFFYSCLTLLNRKLVKSHEGVLISFCEQLFAMIVLLPFVVAMGILPDLNSLLLLVFLGVITTALGHTLFVSSLRTINGQSAGIISSMESVYGIFLAVLILNEWPTLSQVAGGLVILGAAVFNQLEISKKQ